jgi:hypothetical protein
MTRCSQIATMVILAAFMSACQAQDSSNSKSAVSAHSMEDISRIIALHQDTIMALDDVVAIGAAGCEGEPCIRVLLAKDNPDTLAKLPNEIEGVRVVAETSGPITAN